MKPDIIFITIFIRTLTQYDLFSSSFMVPTITSITMCCVWIDNSLVLLPIPLQKQKVANSYPTEFGLVKRFWKYILSRQVWCLFKFLSVYMIPCSLKREISLIIIFSIFSCSGFTWWYLVGLHFKGFIIFCCSYVKALWLLC